MATPSIFVVTGIPGTGVQGSLRRLCARLPYHATVLSVDEFLWQRFCDDAQKNKRILRETDLLDHEVAVGSVPNWWQFLKLPIDRVRYYWQQGAAEVERQVRDSVDDVLFVTFHACYQGDDYRWRLSPVDPIYVQRWQPRAFFAFIDDIFDTHARRRDDLAADRQSVPWAGKDKWTQLAKLVQVSAARQIELLLWREEEIMFTDVLAAICRAPSHVFGVKHPMATLERLIGNPEQSYYFSHPITALRAKPDFPDLEELRHLSELAADIRSSLPLIEPTAIDEFRFQQGGGGECLPSLGARWPLMAPPNELVWSEPGSMLGSAGDFVCPTQNVRELQLASELTELCVGGGPMPAREAALGAVARLREAVAGDITWRDHHLVDQTRRLIVYRPYNEGRPSGGVEREVRYLARLGRTGATTYSSVVFHPDADEERLGQTVARRIMEAWRQDAALGASLRAVHAQAEERLIEEIGREVSFQAPSDHLAELAVQRLEVHYRLEPTTLDPVPMGGGRTTEGRDAQRPLRRRAFEIAAEILRKSKYLDDIVGDPDVPLVLTKSREEFLAWIEGRAREIVEEEGTARRVLGDE